MGCLFDSRNLFYKNPFGAVKQFENVHFKILLPRELKCRKAKLKIYLDGQNTPIFNNMFWCGMNDSSEETWECHQMFKESGIYWYSFELETDFGIKIIGKNQNNSSGILGSNISWQITCYDKNFSTPDWLYGGIMYQIFPDRFFKARENRILENSNRELHSNWGDLPNYLPDKNGEYHNNDYFQGDLLGVVEKIPYLKELGVTCVYLNPIFLSSSNHRYNTADYSKIDPLLGTKDDFKLLCQKLKENNIKLILDGVFSHTGSDSIYFNKYNNFDSVGAFNSKESKYFNWYKFNNWPDDYSSWWGIKSLPEVNEENESFNEFINGKDGIAKNWIRKGASGWRLDVADELPDIFLEKFRKAVKEENPDAVIFGEVWEDASNKISYEHRRKFLLGKQLDSVMNYPFKDAILGFVSGKDGRDMMEIILSILENYPKPTIPLLMNSLSTHDTIRAITFLAGEPYNSQDRIWQASHKLSDSQRKLGIKLMKLASGIQFTLPGIPCIYYGDEVGLEGYLDPFNRKCFPWNNENLELLNWYKYLSNLRKNKREIFSGKFYPCYNDKNILSYVLEGKDSSILCVFNSSKKQKELRLNTHYNNLDIVIESLECKFIKITHAKN